MVMGTVMSMSSWSISFWELELIWFAWDGLSGLVGVTLAFLGMLGLIFGRAHGRRTQWVLLSAAFVALSVACVGAGDFLSLLFFWEGMLLLSFALIMTDPTPGARRIAFRYFAIHIVSGASLFVGVAFQYIGTGDLTMASLTTSAAPWFFIACSVKAAVIPFQFWVPHTYAQIHPATAVLLTAFTTKVGVYAFARFFAGYAPLLWMGSLLAVFGVVMALRQHHLRRMLSYHLISQIGHMLMGLGAATTAGLSAGVFHLMSGVLYKGLLFMGAAQMIRRYRTDDIRNMANGVHTEPVAFWATVGGTLAMVGVAPLNGFVSKTQVKMALETIGWVEPLIWLVSLATAWSLIRYIRLAFLRPATDDHSVPRASSWGEKVGQWSPMIVLLCAVLFSGGYLQLRISELLSGDMGNAFQVRNVIQSFPPLLLGVLMARWLPLGLPWLWYPSWGSEERWYEGIWQLVRRAAAVTEKQVESQWINHLWLIVITLIALLIWLT